MGAVSGWRGRIARVEDAGTQHRFTRGAASDPQPRYAWVVTLIHPTTGELRTRRLATKREAVEWCADMGVEVLP